EHGAELRPRHCLRLEVLRHQAADPFRLLDVHRAELRYRRLQVDDRGARDRVEAHHHQFAAVDGFDSAARYPDAVRSAGAAASEYANGREVGAAAVGAGFAVIVVFRELVEDEEDVHMGEGLQTLEARLAEALVDRDRAADGTPVVRVLDIRPVVPDRTYRCDLEARHG